MYKEIKNALYRVNTTFVECSSLEELFNYVAKEWILKGYNVITVNRINQNGTTPKVKVLTDKAFKKLLLKHRNFKFGVETLTKEGYKYEVTSDFTALVYYKNKPGYTFLDTSDGSINIDGEKLSTWIAKEL